MESANSELNRTKPDVTEHVNVRFYEHFCQHQVPQKRLCVDEWNQCVNFSVDYLLRFNVYNLIRYIYEFLHLNAK